jgi:hypothetical protein
MNTSLLMVYQTIRCMHLFENQYRRIWIVNKVVNKKIQSQSNKNQNPSFLN